jgi:Na+/pantothenate symporter
MVAALYWKRSSAAGAMLSMMLGMGTWLVLRIFVEPELNPFLPALGVSILAQIAGTYLFPRKEEIQSGSV